MRRHFNFKSVIIDFQSVASARKPHPQAPAKLKIENHRSKIENDAVRRASPPLHKQHAPIQSEIRNPKSAIAVRCYFGLHSVTSTPPAHGVSDAHFFSQKFESRLSGNHYLLFSGGSKVGGPSKIGDHSFQSANKCVISVAENCGRNTTRCCGGTRTGINTGN